jgi:hypothetical protein
LEEELEEAIGAEEEDVVARAAGRVAQGRREQRLPDADGAEEDHVFLPLDEAEAKEIADAIAVERDGRVPVEGFEGLLLFEPGTREALREIVLITPVDLVLEGELEELELGELTLAGVGDAVGERREDAGPVARITGER